MATLDPLDAMLLTAELISSPMHVAVALIMSPPKGMTGTAFIDEMYEQGLTAPDPIDPRLRRRPHRGVDTGGLWAWREVADLDLSHHLHRLTLPAGSNTTALWELVSELHAEPLDRSAPLWMAYLIDGLVGDRCVLYIKIHHIVVDGVAGLQMIADSLTTDPDRRGMPPFYASAVPDEPATKRRGFNPLSVVRDIAGAAVSGLSLARNVASAEVANIVGGLMTSTVAAPFGAPHTRFNAKLGPGRVFAATSLDRKRIRAIQDAADVTSNDVVTALVTGVLRDWLTKQDELPDQSLVALCPVTVRGRDAAGDDGHGNQFGLGLCPLPTAIEDPAERLSLVHYAMSNVKHQVAANGPGAMLIVLMPAVVPTALSPLLPFGSRVRPSYNLPISNVPGPRERSYFNGASIDEIYPVSVVYDGMALNVTLCSYADQIGVGYVADRDVLADIDDLIPLTEVALAELEAAVRVA